jgi:hypothetical protein
VLFLLIISNNFLLRTEQLFKTVENEVLHGRNLACLSFYQKFRVNPLAKIFKCFIVLGKWYPNGYWSYNIYVICFNVALCLICRTILSDGFSSVSTLPSDLFCLFCQKSEICLPVTSSSYDLLLDTF